MEDPSFVGIGGCTEILQIDAVSCILATSHPLFVLEQLSQPPALTGKLCAHPQPACSPATVKSKAFILYIQFKIR